MDDLSDDRQLVSLCLQGDMQAFAALVKQYEKLVSYTVFRLIKNKQDMEDICQEVFIKVHRNLYQFDFRAKLSTWIARIAYLTTVDYLKKNEKGKTMYLSDDLDQAHLLPLGDENPEKILTKKEAARQLEHLIGQLPEKYRVVLTLYHLKEFSYSEIGEITGLAEGTVKTHLFRAREHLKEAFLKIYHDPR